ncbi:MAG: hypothetical protein LBJ57_04015, partial [Prevotellaceae bacterium]|nr:hypothetical protein [Prevotellaceae bacterium]
AAFRGGNNNAAYDGNSNSLLGMPATNVSLTGFRAYARNRGAAGKNGAGWNCDVYELQKTCYWLYVVEYANLNSQAGFNAQPTSEGYRQGGLGMGVTALVYALWGEFNDYNPFICCGHTSSLGNQTGVVDFIAPPEYKVALIMQVPSYRGIENPFGHIWSWVDGCKFRIQSDAAGGLSQFYVCDDPSLFQDSDYSDYKLRGNISRYAGYVKEMLIGEFGNNMPKVADASSATYFCDYCSTSIPASGEMLRGLLLGGGSYNGATAGLACTYSSYVPSSADQTFGTRLCFIP